MYIRRGRLSVGDVVQERNGIRFTWDRDKGESNLRKHRVSLEAACEVFSDPFIRLHRSEMLGGEERETAIGLTEDWRLLVVVYTFRQEGIRIISARPATAGERSVYEDSAAP
jgi:uncharacterized DUF497 family protein